MLPVAIVRADAAKAAHIDAKFALAEVDAKLVWKPQGLGIYVAEVDGGAYVLRKQDSGSRVRTQRYRWKALWVPIDSPEVKELACERRREWAKGAAEVHYRRSRS